MRAAVFNRYWSTGGGAEKFGGAIAELLAREHEVELLAVEPVDTAWLGERLRLDLSGVKVRELPETSGAVTRASRDYDLFVNVSYMSVDKAASPRSIYVVHFPTAPDGHLSSLSRIAARALRRATRPPHVSMEWGTGFYARDRGRRSPFWTNGDARLSFVTPVDVSVPVHLLFGYHRPPQVGPANVRVEVDGQPVAEMQLGAPRHKLDALRGQALEVPVRSPRPDEPVELRILSDTFVPAEVLGGADKRWLGVPLRGIRVGGSGWVTRLARWFPALLAQPASTDWLDSYGAVAANSRFTQEWIERYWKSPSELLYPPVTLYPAAEKESTILNVGRFFPAHHGHSKKQLELVRAFRSLCDRGLTGWRLQLAGGCAADGEPYLARVRELAEGYPVELHVNASGEELTGLYGRASIYWHASGLGENARRHPDRLEHFGITTVEAMSAGAVPVVIGLAGQLETVRHGVDGYHFQDLGQLVERTEALIGDEALRHRLSQAAAARAREFGLDAFGRRLGEIVERVTTTTPPSP